MEKIKALFFSQYYGQTILQWQGESLVVNKTTIAQQANGEFKSDYLLLRYVNQLTDKEVETVASIMQLRSDKYFSYQYGNTNRNIWVRQFLYEGTFSYYGGKSNQVVIVYQYLLRIGILLPFTYLDENNQPVTLQPDEIISKGWAKLKTD